MGEVVLQQEILHLAHRQSFDLKKQEIEKRSHFGKLNYMYAYTVHVP